ncbi:MAG: ABC transporter ATP-binding protein [Deltaproteobacteria bacterium]|nr:ABC transporter ATP-binding protein [Deltaproteobacteria bacterium]
MQLFETKGEAGSCPLEVTNLTAYYHDMSEPVWKGLSFRVPKGSTMIVTGGNGSGKSTLLLALCGIIRTTGEIRIFGEVLSEKNLRKLRRLMGVMFEDPEDQLFCPTLYEDLAFGPRNLGLGKEEVEARVKDALEAVGLAGFEGRSPHHMSLGEKRRAALATILTMKPAIYLLDEPTANLDKRHKARMLEIIKRLEGTRVIATHDEEMFGDFENVVHYRLA